MSSGKSPARMRARIIDSYRVPRESRSTNRSRASPCVNSAT